MNRPPSSIEVLLWPLAKLFGALVRIRAFAYEIGWCISEEVGAPVLSVGNLTAGGTGKTPLVSFLIDEFDRRGLKVGVVSRGYGATAKGPARVPSGGESASATVFGDEPSWLAARHPNVPVFICGDRVEAARRLLIESPVKLLLADDAFQHRRLARKIDAVVIDATEPRWHYRLLPLGRLRESMSALSRANVVFLTKTNLADADQLQWLRERLRSYRMPVIEFESRLTGLVPLASGAVMSEGRKVLLVSGIGRPSTFERLVVTDLGAKVAGHMIFRDHHRYTKQDMDLILERARMLGADKIVVTEKDAGKVAPLAGDQTLPIWVTRLETRPTTGLKEFYEIIDRTLF